MQDRAMGWETIGGSFCIGLISANFNGRRRQCLYNLMHLKRKIWGICILMCLDLHLSETVLPDRDERSNTILAVVHENHPTASSLARFPDNCKENITDIPSGSIDSPM